MATEVIRAYFNSFSDAEGVATKLRTIRVKDIDLIQPNMDLDVGNITGLLPAFGFLGTSGSMGGGFSPAFTGSPAGVFNAGAVSRADDRGFMNDGSIVLEATVEETEYEKAVKIINDGGGEFSRI